MTQLDQTLTTVEGLQDREAGSPTSSDNHPTLSPSDSLQSLVTRWLERAQACFDEKDVDQFVDLFSEEGYWRDILTIELDFNSLAKSSIKPYLNQHTLSLPALKNIQLDRLDQLKLTEDGLIQAFIKFETEVYRGTGLLKLIDTPPTSPSTSIKAFLFFTQVWEVKGHEERRGFRRPLGVSEQVSPEKRPLNWLEERVRSSERYKDGVDPTVLIIGGGQNGLSLAARLKVLGIDSLVVEKSERLGDCWRRRYDSLCLHDPVWADHLAYMPYPPTWPVYTPKDKLANWFEHYAESMELDVWLQATLVPGAEYDPESECWTTDVRLFGTEGTPARSIRLRPRYLVLATGLNAAPHWPTNISHLDSYAGTVVHSSQFKSAKEWRGKRAVVVGACNSAHDIAAELYHNGAAEVTMVQRSKTFVMSSQHGISTLMKGLYEEGGLATEDADLIFTSLPINLLEIIHTKVQENINKLDQDLVQSLENVGFKVDPYPSGMLIKYFRRGGGYYIDVGCSQLIASRKIHLKQGHEVTRLTEHGLRFDDGEEIEADIIVFATGYQSIRTSIHQLISETVAQRLGPVWGKDSQGEIPGTWRLNGQPGLWLMCGNFFQARCYSKHLATQILLQELKIHDKNWPGRAHSKVCRA
ncbi:hypothetical protein PGTUg99_007169 [Puccinia graminis f. sp. tritici]|uniref:FAD/NAD(P)-binding domain-containing protein n=1 Tax=Puccinia graminis f. sp. tritici TaxID=56615 RepID=A0A5B0P210_PUCGR|nr:hypothetical protein PGTUg99_007169 [Puccinia graminis f. sp. tritici]